MKVYANANFPVTVREERLEHAPELASLYEGSFSVQCNHVVEVRFVPPFRTAESWPPVSEFADSFDWDAPPDAITARWAVAMTSAIVVSPGEVEQQETFDPRLDGSPAHLVTVHFSVFEAISREVQELLEERPALAWTAFGGGGVPIHALESTQLVRFLRSRVLRAPLLDAQQLRLLGAIES